MKPLSRDELDMLTQRIQRDRKAGATCRNWVEPFWMQQAERLIAEVEGYRATEVRFNLSATGPGDHTFTAEIVPGDIASREARLLAMGPGKIHMGVFETRVVCNGCGGVAPSRDRVRHDPACIMAPCVKENADA